MYMLEGVSSVTIGQIIFHFFWDHWSHCGIFENGVLLMYTLEGVSSVHYENTPIQIYRKFHLQKLKNFR